jgi:hypothetical protein
VKQKRHICVVAKAVTLETLAKHPCCFHHHINWRELNEYHVEGTLQPVDGVREHAKDDEGREPDYLLEWLVPGRVLRFKREIPHRGLSSKYGTYLAEELKRRRPWAKAMIADMQAGRGGRMQAAETLGF